MIFKFFFAFAVIVAASAAKQDDESLMKILAKERKEMREERREMRKIFQRETARLEKEDRKLQRQNDEQKEENIKQSQEIQQLKEKLRHADVVAQNSLRQKEQRGSVLFELKKIVKAEIKNFMSLEFKGKMNSTMHEDDVQSELQKIVNAEIKDFLISEKICVSGIIGYANIKLGAYTTTVQFHHEFPRKPTVTASLSYIYNSGNHASHTQAYTEVKKVTTTTADIYIYKGFSVTSFDVAWIACL